jgi:VanZ family protein
MTTPVEDFSRFLKRWLPALFWMGLILFASTDVGSEGISYGLLKPVLRWFDPHISEPSIYEINIFLRKTMHVIQFAILAILVWRARNSMGRPPRLGNLGGIVFTLFIAAIFAAGSEWVQHFMKFRGSCVSDVWLDMGGASLGLLLLFLYKWVRRHFSAPGKGAAQNPA